jgi:hypothetical protein
VRAPSPPSHCPRQEGERKRRRERRWRGEAGAGAGVAEPPALAPAQLALSRNGAASREAERAREDFFAEMRGNRYISGEGHSS